MEDIYNEEHGGIGRLISLIHQMRAIREQPPSSITTTISLLEPITTEIRHILGVEITKIVNNYKDDRVGNIEDKRAVARALNDIFDSFGMRIKCPKTGRPAILLGATRGDGHGDGRFQLLIKENRARPVSSATMPEIELIPRESRNNHRGIDR